MNAGIGGAFIDIHFTMPTAVSTRRKNMPLVKGQCMNLSSDVKSFKYEGPHNFPLSYFSKKALPLAGRDHNLSKNFAGEDDDDHQSQDRTHKY